MSRALTEKEKSWIRKLRGVIKSQPSTLSIRQSNEGGELVFYDRKTGEKMYEQPHVQGFPEGEIADKLDDCFM